MIQLHRSLPSMGRFRILTLLSTDLLTPTGTSATTLKAISTLAINFLPFLLKQTIIYPRLRGEESWDNIPSCVKEQAEVSFYNGYELGDAYEFMVLILSRAYWLLYDRMGM
ncbi:hypothetical protein BDV12DRAFT_166663 [Aspergillus spectabilis]